MSQFRVSAKAVESGVWLAITTVEADSFPAAIRKVRAHETAAEFKGWPLWKATLIGNRTGKNLGRERVVRV